MLANNCTKKHCEMRKSYALLHKEPFLTLLVCRAVSEAQYEIRKLQVLYGMHNIHANHPVLIFKSTRKIDLIQPTYSSESQVKNINSF